LEVLALCPPIVSAVVLDYNLRHPSVDSRILI
jgi:hypothetical protein